MALISWQSDNEGEFFVLRSENFDTEVRPSNTTIYKHTPEHEKLDHFFVRLSEDDPTMGFFCWRELVNRALGEGSYDDATLEMRERGFEERFMDEPDEYDIQRWEETFKEKYEADFTSIINGIIEKAMQNFDAAWKYYSAEWGEDGASGQ